MLGIYAALGGLAAGIALSERVPYSVAVGVGCCSLLAAGFRRSAAISLMGLIGIAATCGLVVTAARDTPTSLESLAGRIPRCELKGRLLEHAGGLGSLLSADLLTCQGFAPGREAGVVVIEPSEIAAGSLVVATGWLVPLRADDTFDDARRALGAHSEFDVDEIEQQAAPRGLHGVASGVRDGLERATAGMDQERAGLLSGLTTGDTTGMGPATEEQLRRAGLTHLVAVSGSNVAIVVGATALMVSRLALPLRVLACGLALGLFVLVVGPEPSVMRASVMGLVGLLALAAGRRTEPLHALGLALVVLLTLRPGLVSSVGLHLSVAATAGIVLFSGHIRRALGWLPDFAALGLAATLAAQFAVAPVLVGTFGELSLVAPVANLLAIPAVAPATVFGLLAACMGAFAPPLGWLCARTAEPCLIWVLAVGRTMGDWSWASIGVPTQWAWPLWGLLIAAALASLKAGPAEPLSVSGEPLVAGEPK